MNIKLFYHSLVSDWNHGNAHFLRGIARELLRRGHNVEIYEPADGWSRTNLIRNKGQKFIGQFYEHYPDLDSKLYNLSFSKSTNGQMINRKNGWRDILNLDLDRELSDADLVIVHEWNDPKLVKKIGRYRSKNAHFRLLYHDTHHRSVTAPQQIAALELADYDGVLAYGEVIKEIYLKNNWIEKGWTWHEAADTTVFYPRESKATEGDVIWIGNWGDDERSEKLRQFLLRPIHDLGLNGRIYGVRYPGDVISELMAMGIAYGDWLPNYKVPEEFARYKLTVHVQRDPYCKMLPGIPTIRPFEAMACGIPLLSAPWNDCEHLFRAGEDLLFASDEEDMKKKMKQLIHDDEMRKELAKNGLETIRTKHSCVHRVDELMVICKELNILKEKTEAL